VKEKIKTAKNMFIIGVVALVGGLVTKIFLKRSMPVLAETLRVLGYVVAIGAMCLGAIWIIAGDQLIKIWKKKFNKTYEPEVYYSPEETLVKEQLKTEVATQQTKRKQMDNLIELQKARIEQIKVRTQAEVKKNGTSSPSLGSGFGDLSDFMIGGKPKVQPPPPQQEPKRKKKRSRRQEEPEPSDDVFFKW